ncbi:hypothetical protein [Ralstonia phage RSP15]|uniref:sulfatase-modifying factor enzyme n=1 Tax=Ralstonia phage RSP15 TaxID=1785960 RepID=UPI00074D4B09|nr:sulfatase-modifying factor enzyme [Ralstonia phage RSP15]BAU40111.1 hypothetical protein [Ralstonia phage RSP15]
MSNKEIGLFEKFTVYRNDGRDCAGGDKENAEYFVLDYVNDPFARIALRRYASVCAPEYPELAADLMKKLEEVQK